MPACEGDDEICLLHFNDVYHLQDTKLVARFAAIFSEPHHAWAADCFDQQPVRIFSGDAFSPSLEASVTRGEHMGGVLNSLQLDVACYGNHDFDFGESRLAELSSGCNFPWTLANVVHKDTAYESDGQLLASAHRYVIKEVNGYRLGFFGLAGTDWPSNCLNLPECCFLDPGDTACEVASHLRLIEKCDVVVALTHMRLAEDLAVAQATRLGDARVDLILGGHDHCVVQSSEHDTNNDASLRQTIDSQRNGKIRIVKSGTDWHGLSLIRLSLRKEHDGVTLVAEVEVKQVENIQQLPQYNHIPESKAMLRVISEVRDKVNNIVDQPLWYTRTSLDGHSMTVRSQETSLGNMLADATRTFHDTDLAIINSGAIRCDRIIQPTTDHALLMRDAIEISPFDNIIVVKRVLGRSLIEALENSVSDMHLDGRFLQVSGLRVEVDWLRPQGQRIRDVKYHPEFGKMAPLDKERTYSVAMIEFLASGFDGYSCFQHVESEVDGEGAMTDTNLLLRIFCESDTSGADARHSQKFVAGLARARKAIIVARHEADGLPIVNPCLDGRITSVTRQTTGL